jgi:hypothetical protein
LFLHASAVIKMNAAKIQEDRRGFISSLQDKFN